MTSVERIPRLIAFDLDGTIWRPEMYELWGGGAPFTKDEADNTLRDRSGTKVKLLGESASILDSLTKPPFEDTVVVWVSCTDEPKWADECLTKFTTANGITSIGDVSNKKLNKIFKSNKRVHFEQLAKDTGIPFSDMLFFDNEGGNISNVAKLGVIR